MYHTPYTIHHTPYTIHHTPPDLREVISKALLDEKEPFLPVALTKEREETVLVCVVVYRMVYGPWSMVYGLWSMVYGVWCIVYRMVCVGVYCMVYGAWCEECVVRVWYGSGALC